MRYSLLIKDDCEICSKTVEFLVKNRIEHTLLTRMMPEGKELEVPILLQHFGRRSVVIGGYEDIIKHFIKEKK